MDLFVPGRVCLFGEHSDWAGGYRRVAPHIQPGHTLISGTDQGIYARVAAHPDALILTAAAPGERIEGPQRLPMEAAALLQVARQGGFWSYIAGVAYQVQRRYPVAGLVLENTFTDLPVQKGLSSSAAICVLTARAFNRLYDLGLSVREEMELAYQGEITTPSRCGRMDQGCAFGRRAVLMTFDGDHLETRELRAAQPVHLVVVDLGARKDTQKILADLNACYPEPKTAVARGVQRLLGPLNAALVREAVAALEAGDGARLGELMKEAQRLFDRYAVPACPEELSAPVLHRVLNHPSLSPHIWGGKGVGSQGDGAAQFVARSAADQEAVVELAARALGMSALLLTIEPGNQDSSGDQ